MNWVFLITFVVVGGCLAVSLACVGRQRDTIRRMSAAMVDLQQRALSGELTPTPETTQTVLDVLNRMIEFREGSPSIAAQLELPGLALFRQTLYTVFPDAPRHASFNPNTPNRAG